jgi:hypothetical protein
LYCFTISRAGGQRFRRGTVFGARIPELFVRLLNSINQEGLISLIYMPVSVFVTALFFLPLMAN